MKVVFLGCAGGRRVTFKQHRGSGGFLVEANGVLLHVDPGPGALIRSIQIGIDPQNITGFLLTHRHLDHSADINTLIEAKTLGGWAPGGTLISPQDTLEGEDPVVFRYHRKYLENIFILNESTDLELNSLKIKTAARHAHHGVETFGVVFEHNGLSLGYITDGRFEDFMLEAYKNLDFLIVNTTFRSPRELDHMSLEDAVRIFKTLKPKLGIIYHFGMEILRMGLEKAASFVEELSGVKTTAAREFLAIDFKERKIEKVKLKNPVGFMPYWK